ncbi:MAG: NarK/NasA family nitrate transporter [Gammaproteobacteria bacterium]|nr:NarK/NasA family nitrate transporter [Gammaproteobacteria bacterium]
MSWILTWRPEDPQFWHDSGRYLAWRTLTVTTFSLVASFATWFVMSAVVVLMPRIGFQFTTMQLFWLAAMPGLAGGSLRLVHSFLVPIFGSRLTLTSATLLKLIPMLWLGFAIQDPTTPYSTFLVIAFLCGMGGGDFSSFMPSTSLFFPKRLQGTAMGVQAGVGNLGVSITQFVTPWVISFGALGAVVGVPQTLRSVTEVPDVVVTKADGVVTELAIGKPEVASQIVIQKDETGMVTDVAAREGGPAALRIDVRRNEQGAVTDVRLRQEAQRDVWVQNAAFWYVPYLLIAGLLCWVFLRSVPVKASFREQLDIMRSKHTWFCVVTYIMTFGSFSGFAAAFPIMIRTIYGGFDDAPEPLKYAFIGPLVGSLIRAVGGPLSDRFGGSIWTQISGAGLIAGCLFLILGGYLTPTSVEQFDGFLWGMLWIFLMAGIGNFATFRQYPIIFAHSPRQGAQVLGWTGAWAAFGPFVFSSLIGVSITATGSAKTFFCGAVAFYVLASAVNWVYYTRPGAVRGDWGKGRTWWDRIPEAERERLRAQG